MNTNVDRVRTMLQGIETGDPNAVLVIDPDTYIQHNPQTHTGRGGLAALFARLATTSPRVNIVRAFPDGDYVFGHTEYDFATRRFPHGPSDCVRKAAWNPHLLRASRACSR